MNRLSTAPLRVAFRVDASVEIGTGHVMRCLTLADAFRAHGMQCIFVSRCHRGHMRDHIEAKGYPIVMLPPASGEVAGALDGPCHAHWLGTDWATDANDTCRGLGNENVDWLVVDHYALDRCWEGAMRASCQRLMVIDDLADRQHDCDLLLDQSLGRLPGDYAGLLLEGCSLLLGPQFGLLRPEFARLRPESLRRRMVPEFRNLLVTMGGVDKNNVTLDILNVLDEAALPQDVCITLVMGSKAPWLLQVQERAQRMMRSTTVLVGVSDMASLMAESDLAIGAAGGTSWERCCLGLPSITLVLAENQIAVAAALAAVDATVVAHNPHEVGRLLQDWISSGRISQIMAQTSAAGAKIADGSGVRRVVERMVAHGD